MLKCVMYFSEYILKYIITKVKKKMLVTITMNIFFHIDTWKYWVPK